MNLSSKLSDVIVLYEAVVGPFCRSRGDLKTFLVCLRGKGVLVSLAVGHQC